MFHGTSQKAIDSIVAQGFKIGGTEGVAIIAGAAHGNGIYLSEDPDFAQRYIKDGVLRHVCQMRPMLATPKQRMCQIIGGIFLDA